MSMCDLCSLYFMYLLYNSSEISRRPSVTEEIEKRKIPDIVEDLSVNSAFKVNNFKYA